MSYTRDLLRDEILLIGTIDRSEVIEGIYVLESRVLLPALLDRAFRGEL
jgi:hypothetical protein